MRLLFPSLLLIASLGCITAPPPAPYPHEHILTVFAELRLHLGRDPYRLPPGTDLQGRNVFRVTLERLDSLAGLSGPEYSDILAFARGQCLERLGAWRGAAAAFDDATSAGTSLADPAAAHAAAARRMAELTDRLAMNRATAEAYLNDLEAMDQRLLQWATGEPEGIYAGFCLAEAERGRQERAGILFDDRRRDPQKAGEAIEIARSLTEDFQESWRVSEHWLLLGGFYERLARDWSEQFPAEGPAWDDGGRWLQWIESARIAYRKVALADGDPVKPEGQARLRMIDAYALRIQSLLR